MTYARTPVFALPHIIRRPAGLSGVMDGGGVMIIGGVLVVAVIGTGIYFAVKSAKAEREVRARIAEKEGSAGLAKYEDAKTKRAAVEGGLGILSGLAWGGGNGMRRNKRRSHKRKSRR